VDVNFALDVSLLFVLTLQLSSHKRVVFFTLKNDDDDDDEFSFGRSWI
jgi:hypothetical protein